MRSLVTEEIAIVGIEAREARELALAGRYSLQRPALDAVLECIEVLRGTRQTLPSACVELTSTTDLVTRIRR
jgi:hypothetical protein